MARSIDIKRSRGSKVEKPADQAESEPDDVKPNEFYDNPETKPTSKGLKIVNIILTIILVGLIGAIVYLVLEPGAKVPEPSETQPTVREQLKSESRSEPTEPKAVETPPPAEVTSPGNLSVTVLNGSGTAGAAQATATTLKAASYNVTTVGNAKRFNYSNTTIFYKSGRLKEAEAAATAIGKPGASLEEENSVTAGVDLVVVVGAK